MMRKKKLLLFMWLVAPICGWTQLPLHPERGIVAKWEGEQTPLDSNHLGTDLLQVEFSWRELEGPEGTFHFDNIDKLLTKADKAGLKAFVKVRTDLHPDYIFGLVPYLKDFSVEGSRDHEGGYGMPMFWSKTYGARYARLLYELGSHFRDALYGTNVLGIIPDIRETGADDSAVNELFTDSSGWVLPEGMSHRELPPWDENTWNEHMNWLHQVHSRAGSGALWLYQEHSAPQPGNREREVIARFFEDNCKKGVAYGYSETDGMQTGLDATDEQFMTWTVLYNLRCGASFLALPPEYSGKTEFAEDLEFFRKYAGSLSNPASAPGIWTAFREGDSMPGDYNFLMERNRVLPSDALEDVGPGGHGLWARRIDSLQTIRLKMDMDFIESLDPTRKITIRVRYLDDNHSLFRIHAFGGIHPIQKTGSGAWKEAEITRRPRIKSQLLDVVAMDGPLTVHKVEILR